jgi:hypothetical protein
MTNVWLLTGHLAKVWQQCSRVTSQNVAGGIGPVLTGVAAWARVVDGDHTGQTLALHQPVSPGVATPEPHRPVLFRYNASASPV